MPTITNVGKTGRDVFEREIRTAPLGGSLEYRTRRSLFPELNNFSWFAAGTITTTRRTLGIPLESVVNLAEFPSGSVGVTVAIASTSAADVGVTGIGARTITIQGLDQYWEPFTESNIVLNGTTPVNPVNQFFRINRMFVDESGSTTANQGDIYMSYSTDTFISGVPQTSVLHAMISGENASSFGQRSFGAHTVTHYIKGNTYTNGTPDNPVLIEERYIAPNFTGSRTDYTSGALWYTSNISYNFDGAAPLFEKTDARWVVTASSGIREGSIYYEFAQLDELQDYNRTFSFNQVKVVLG